MNTQELMKQLDEAFRDLDPLTERERRIFAAGHCDGIVAMSNILLEFDGNISQETVKAVSVLTLMKMADLANKSKAVEKEES